MIRMTTKPRYDVDGRLWAPVQASGNSSWRDVRWSAAILTADRPGDYELEYRVASPEDTPDTGWYLYGGGIFGRYMGHHLADAITEAADWISGSAYERYDAQDNLEQDSLDDSEAIVLALPVRTEEDVAREDELVQELRKAHADQERATAELAEARQRRREAAAGLRSIGRSMSWIAGKIGVTQQAVDGFLKYKERKNRAG